MRLSRARGPSGISGGRARGATLTIVVIGVFSERSVGGGPGRSLHIHVVIVRVTAAAAVGVLVGGSWRIIARVHVHGDRGWRRRLVMRAAVSVSYHA